MTASFLVVSGANCLPSRCFVRGQTTWQSLIPIPPTGLVTGCSTLAGSLLTNSPTFPYSPVFFVVVSISLDPLWRAWIANSLQQMLAWSQLLQPGYRRLAMISCVLLLSALGLVLLNTAMNWWRLHHATPALVLLATYTMNAGPAIERNNISRFTVTLFSSYTIMAYLPVPYDWLRLNKYYVCWYRGCHSQHPHSTAIC
jgi:hypothetical protein